MLLEETSMEEKIIIESTHSKKINVICSAIIIVLYVVYCEAMYLSNDAWTTFGYWFVRRIFIPIIFLALIFFSTRTNICVTKAPRPYLSTIIQKSNYTINEICPKDFLSQPLNIRKIYIKYLCC